MTETKPAVTFISRFAFEHLEVCFGASNTWKARYSAEGPERPKGYVLRDSLRGKYSPVHKLPPNSRLREHILESGANSRMNTIMTELSEWRPKKRFLKFMPRFESLLGCCGASRGSFSMFDTDFLLKEKRAQDIVEALTVALTQGGYVTQRGEKYGASGSGASGTLFYLPLTLLEKYGDVFEAAGWHLSHTDGKELAILFKSLVSKAQLLRGERRPFKMDTKDFHKAAHVETSLAEPFPHRGWRTHIKHSYTVPLGEGRSVLSKGFGGFFETPGHYTLTILKETEELHTKSTGEEASLEVCILRTRGPSYKQIETHYLTLKSLGFEPMTPDGLPYLNGNYPNVPLGEQHWLLPMCRVNPKWARENLGEDR